MRSVMKTFVSVLLAVMLCIAPVAGAQASTAYYGTIKADKTNLCYGPSSGTYGVKAKLPVGTRVIYGAGNYYVKAITEFGVSGYVFRGLINQSGYTTSARIYKCTRSLAVRAGQGTGRLKGYTQRNQRVILLSKGAKWSKIKTLRGTVGYVETKYISYGM